MSCEILVAAHKKFNYINFDDCYKVIQVGSTNNQNKLPYLHDDSYDNISKLNSTYCELTALYWGWKNIHSDIKGLCHYRRYPAHHIYSLNQRKNVLHETEIQYLLQHNDILIPKPEYRTLELSWYPSDKDLQHDRPYMYTKKAVAELCPEYLPAVEQFYHGNTISPLNILIARSDVYNAYCAWLFPLADRITEMLEADGGVPKREIGFITERFLSIWLLANKDSYSIEYFSVTRTDNKTNLLLFIKVIAERIYLLSAVRYIKSHFSYTLLKIKSFCGISIINKDEWV